MSKLKSAPFVMIERTVLDSFAWRSMSMGARVLYLALRRRYNRDYHNNGKIYISVRLAATELGANRNQISRWYHELQHYGFIVMTKPGNLGLNGSGRAAHWRLTEVGYLKEMPTRDYERWTGELFVPESRDTRLRLVKNRPGQRDSKNKTLSRPQGHTVPATGTYTVPANGTVPRKTVLASGTYGAPDRPGHRDITS
jgi:hypothetical protein